MTKINPSGTRFTSMNGITPQGKIETSGRLSTIFTDYNLWTELSKGLGNKSYKAITEKGNLIYIIER